LRWGLAFVVVDHVRGAKPGAQLAALGSALVGAELAGVRLDDDVRFVARADDE
jgi:hypothetical protein